VGELLSKIMCPWGRGQRKMYLGNVEVGWEMDLQRVNGLF